MIVKPISLIAILISYIPCSCNAVEESELLPEQYKISTKEDFHGSLYNIYSYSIAYDSIGLTDLKDFPGNCPNSRNCQEECNLVKWKAITDLNTKEHDRLVASIVSENEHVHNQMLSRLVAQIEARENLYFAGCYTMGQGAGSQRYRFYEYRYILSPTDRTLLVFDYMEDPF